MPPKQLVRDSDRKFRLLFEENPQPMWVVDPDSQRFLESNDAASRLYGYSADEFRALALADIDPGGNPPLTALPQNRLEARRHCSKSGGVVDVEVAVHDIDYGGRRAQLAVIVDSSSRRALEEQLRQAQKMEAVGMLAGGVAHDFNNLLTIINGYSQLILNSLRETDPNRHSAEQILKAGERAAALTKQLLAFSRRQVMQMRVVDLNKLVTSLGTMLQRLIGEDIDLRMSLKSDLGRVNADPGQVEQVIMNLVVNARDAMPAGGVLTLETANVDLDAAYATRHMASKPGRYIMLAVSDTGTGMDAATKARLFEPFFTTKGSGKGTGLGLSTVFGIVKQGGGSVEVYSEPDRGTSVKVYLPRVDEPAAVEAEHGAKFVRRGWESVLVVEDDEMVRTLVRETLENHGYRVLEANGPLEARRISDQYSGPVHLLITDVVMPKVNGRELAQQLRRRRGGMRVLYMSGYTDNAVLNSGILAKDVAFLQKPFTPRALVEKVRETLEADDGQIRTAGE
jgi:two-component system, cell cycle sensor histidine kinase and response regulator CckA